MTLGHPPVAPAAGRSQPLSRGPRRAANRLLAGLRKAGYLRQWLVLGTLIGVVAGLGAVVFYDGLSAATRYLLGTIGGYTPAGTIGEGGARVASGFARPWAIPLVVGGGGLLAGLLVFALISNRELVRGWQLALSQSALRLAGAVTTTSMVDTTVNPAAPADGVAIRDLPLPLGTVIVSLTRGDAMIAPNGDLVLNGGDSITLVTRSADLDQVRALFEAPPAGERVGDGASLPAGQSAAGT